MKTIKTILISIIMAAIIIPSALFAQDIIYKKDKQELKCKIREIGLETVKYMLGNESDGPVIELARTDIWKIKLQNGDEMIITAPIESADPKQNYDLIYTSDKKELKCKITEINSDEIKYFPHNMLNGPMVIIRRADVWKIKLQNGDEMIVSQDPRYDNPESLIADKKKIVKFELFSPLTGNSTFCYEQSIKQRISLEARLGIIGAGVNSLSQNKAAGVFLKMGPKLFMYPEIHPLRGQYIKPEITLSGFNISKTYYGPNTYQSQTYPYTYTSQTINARGNIFCAAFHIVYGRQLIVANVLVIDYFGGIGYSYSDVINSTSGVPRDFFRNSTYYYSHVSFGKNFPLSFTGGFSLGYIFR